jgi:hypothetical protein
MYLSKEIRDEIIKTQWQMREMSEGALHKAVGDGREYYTGAADAYQAAYIFMNEMVERIEMV